MKKLLLILFPFASVISFAQFSKGSILTGGSFSADFTTDKNIYGSTTITYSSTTSLSVLPNVGYFIIDNVVGGAGLQLNTSSTKFDASQNSTSFTSFAFQPFGRYYYKRFYGQASVGFGSYRRESNAPGSRATDKGSLFNWSLAGGYVFLLNEHVGLEPQIGYQSQSQSPDGLDITLRNAGLFLRLGLQFYLKK